ncbi:hypothetical protein T02_16186 [Trichinella nativa]|uniref:Uncharacterized protein n=1 Tax=Trichinella nativa TaxID=6335 RepID=A0A0V1LG36_9BILA|nr:hypothetical protein T02_16186 [Trichinella nativa]
MTWRWTPSHLTFAKALIECNGVGCRHILTDAKALAGAVILMNGCDWTMVLAMVQCSRLPEESISVPVMWLLGSVIQTTNLSVRIKRSSTFWCHQPGTEGADAIAVAETFHALEECFCKCQEAQMQYKIRLGDGNSHERELEK